MFSERQPGVDLAVAQWSRGAESHLKELQRVEVRTFGLARAEGAVHISVGERGDPECLYIYRKIQTVGCSPSGIFAGEDVEQGITPPLVNHLRSGRLPVACDSLYQGAHRFIVPVYYYFLSGAHCLLMYQKAMLAATPYEPPPEAVQVSAAVPFLSGTGAMRCSSTSRCMRVRLWNILGYIQ